jgi:hypothetical protein
MIVDKLLSLIKLRGSGLNQLTDIPRVSSCLSWTGGDEDILRGPNKFFLRGEREEETINRVNIYKRSQLCGQLYIRSTMSQPDGGFQKYQMEKKRP